MLLLILLLVTVAATTWLARRQDVSRDLLPEAARGPDAWADDVSLRVLDTTGRPAYNLTAAHVAWYPGDDQLALRAPRLDVTRPDGTRWQLTAEHGRTSRARDPVSLIGIVTIQRLADSSQKPLTITTADVTVLPNARMAVTEAEARIDGQGYAIDTRGLTADLANNRLELRSQVRGRFDGRS
jgi:lipopolysaccharide export system protein LptC